MQMHGNRSGRGECASSSFYRSNAELFRFQDVSGL